MSVKTIRDYITDIQSRYSKGVRSTDSRLSNRMVYNKMEAIRAKLINEKANKNQTFSDSFYQLLAGVEMESVKSSMLDTVNIGKNIRGTVHKLPAFIYSIDVPIIASVSNIENSKVYNRTSWQTIKNSIGRKYTGTQPNYFTLENNIYINSSDVPKVIAVRAIFARPIDAQLYLEYNGCTPPSCLSYLDLHFAVDTDMGNTISEMVSEILINSYYGKREEDRVQNAVDNTK